MVAKDMKLLWKSPNGKWEIKDASDGRVYIAEVQVTDGWSAYYAGIDENGRVTGGLFNTQWQYVPKTIEKKAISLLRKMYVEKYRTPQGKKVMPYSYFVKPWANLREYDGVVPNKDYRPPLKYFRTYESAYKYARSLWNAYTATQKKYMYLTIGRFDKTYDTIKEIPENFRYSHVSEISKDYPPKRK